MSDRICLLTEAEVAGRLKCSVSKIRKLRYAGAVPFIPGRPVLIMERDFLKLERQQQEQAYARWAARKVRRRATKPPDPPSVLAQKADGHTRKRAIAAWLRMRAKW